MGGSKGPNTGAMQRSYDAGYQAFSQGKPEPTTSNVQTNDPNFSYFHQGWAAAKAESAARKQQAAAAAQMQHMMMSMARAQEESSRQMQEQMAKLAADREESARKAAEEAKRATDLKRRDQLFSERVTNASLATDYVNNQINEERSAAQLLGFDFNITDEQKKTRINDYFATLWGEGSQIELDQLIKQYGNPEGFSGTWDVVRGTAKQATKGGEPKTLASSKGVPRLATLATGQEEDESLLGG